MSDGESVESVISTSISSDVTPVLSALRDQVEQRQIDGGNLAVLIIECGLIGRVDAVWGYSVGDLVRGRVAELLRSDVLREGDFVGGIGREDFACVLSTIEGPAVALLAAQKSIRAFNAPFWIGEEEVFADPAIGIAMFPTHGDQAENLLQRSKSACALARVLNGRIASAGDDGESHAESLLLGENRLRTAVLEDTLELIFQPQYDLRRGQIMGAECLLRALDPLLGMVAVADAYNAAESAGTVSGFVSSVLNRALRNVSEFRYSGGLDLRIGIKLPSRALLNTELPDIVQRALGTWSRRAGTLILGIGGTALLKTDAVARETLVRLRELGVKLSIDDPELELTTLYWLAGMPFQEVKIDVSTTPDMVNVPKSARILQSVIELAHHLKLNVVAVGVTDEAHELFLKELGCDYMQGDFKGPALDPKGFVEKFGFSED
ncbi:MAG: GGDEF domain-containing phosphodiesterase [Sulfuritalea sp.]|nr:GGDEF domain-containing phosphodiesterase [Sulfuritalea sp.]